MIGKLKHEITRNAFPIAPHRLKQHFGRHRVKLSKVGIEASRLIHALHESESLWQARQCFLWT